MVFKKISRYFEDLFSTMYTTQNKISRLLCKGILANWSITRRKWHLEHDPQPPKLHQQIIVEATRVVALVKSMPAKRPTAIVKATSLIWTNVRVRESNYYPNQDFKIRPSNDKKQEKERGRNEIRPKNRSPHLLELSLNL